VDTGASSLILFEPQTLPASPVRISAVQRPGNMMGQFEGKPMLLRSLRLGPVEYRQEPAFLVHSRADATDSLDGLLNPATLGIAKIAFDFNQGVLAFSR
jgi:hypothetical protein